jgi:polyisoprenoid-binding protein YceI
MLTQARCRQVLVQIPALLALGVLGGCVQRRAELPAPEPAPAPAAAAPAEVPAGARAYDVDADASEVTLRVYRAGPLARLGHNHVITSTGESGVAWVAAGPGQSGFVVRVPVAGLVVDDPAARAAAGTDFPGEVPADAREGTRRNMLRPEVLDGDRYPEIVVRADALGGTWEQPSAEARVTLRSETRSLPVPLSVEMQGNALVARGSFRILQSEFGIKPFSVAGGAIQVADEVEVAFEIRATAR